MDKETRDFAKIYPVGIDPDTGKPMERYGCIPVQTLEEIRQEIREMYPGTTDEELEAMGC